MACLLNSKTNPGQKVKHTLIEGKKPEIAQIWLDLQCGLMRTMGALALITLFPLFGAHIKASGLRVLYPNFVLRIFIPTRR